MKKHLLGLVVGLSLIGTNLNAGSNEYTVSVVGTPTNVAHYLIYSDGYPSGHEGPGDFFYLRAGDAVHVWGKLDLQATTANSLMSIQLSLPFPATISNYAYAVGNANNPGSKPSGAIFGSQIGVEGNNTSVVLKLIPTTTDMRAYAVQFDYIADPLE